jgi:AraC-like DNA-binding protein
MESFFFNITDTRYKITPLLKKNSEHITRVDISNGVVFLDVSLNSNELLDFHIKNLDRMIMICVIKKGSLHVKNNLEKKNYVLKNGSISIYASSRQDLQLETKKYEKSDIFILFLADFFLKRYLTSNKNEPIDFLYQKIQDEISLESINTQATDALSLYIIDKIINTQQYNNMNSIRCEHSVVEFLIHRLSLCDMITPDISDEELCISRRAKDILLKSFASPPSIPTLAHLCATNESKIKKVFKKVYKTTIYNYTQKLRLEEANLLLKEQNQSIGEISKKIGYKHQGHFSKLFFETYGIYPKDLLKR